MIKTQKIPGLLANTRVYQRISDPGNISSEDGLNPMLEALWS
jgi:hypothetical protein